MGQLTCWVLKMINTASGTIGSTESVMILTTRTMLYRRLTDTENQVRCRAFWLGNGDETECQIDKKMETKGPNPQDHIR
jgi:hypothetical protein